MISDMTVFTTRLRCRNQRERHNFMTRLLHVVGSPRRDKSASRAIADTFIDAYHIHHPEHHIDILDLWSDPIPAFDGDRAAAKMTVIGGDTPEGDQATAWQSITNVFDRFNAADRYVFSVPMWNAGIPWALKQFIDTITQPGMIFSFDPARGYSGLLSGKNALAIYTSGVFSPGVSASFGSDFHSTYFDDWMRFAGITDISEIRFQPTLMTDDYEGGLSIARAEAREMAATFGHGESATPLMTASGKA